MSTAPTPLKFLAPGAFAIVMGLSGLALAWHRAQPLMGEMAGAFALVIGACAALAFAALGVATLLRWQRHPEAWAEDRRHPVRHVFIASLPVGVILLATVAVALFGPTLPGRLLWWAGSLSQLGVTVWVFSRWFRASGAGGPGGLQWPSVTPALFIPSVGNAVVPLAGVPLGHADWAAAQFGIGALLWPVTLSLIAVRIAVAGMWPERLMPTLFILIAPPTVVGLSALQMGAPLAVGWALWGVAIFTALWCATQARRIVSQPFGLPHWGLSFPLAALAAFTLRLATPGGVLAVLGPVLLALASLVILALSMATVRGLRDGTLLVPEPVATITPVA